MVPLIHRKACRAAPVSLSPTTAPASLIARAVVPPGPPSPPRSITA
jgi:hypothetical protein